ncbi:thiamine phosphate synthase [Paenibacillus sp. WLX2291]|uniref:thiamine phosphate synthase n=1 Tax=Paenibacillus sp. WLX2291 TaxID=3296934 RepID=UPI0039840B63
MELHVVTPGTLTQQGVIDISVRIHPYVTAIHIREKSWTEQQIIQTVQQMLLRDIPAFLIVINNHPQLALELGVGGVHLPEFAAMYTASDCIESDNKSSTKSNHNIAQSSSLTISRSVHSVERAWEAEQEGCHYAIFGHIYATQSKHGVEPRGVEQLAKVCSATNMPIIAIGGIQPHHCAELHAAGAAGIAVMSSIFTASSPLQAVQQYADAIQQTGSAQQAVYNKRPREMNGTTGSGIHET